MNVLVQMKKPVRRASLGDVGLREATTGAVVLPRVWAVGVVLPVPEEKQKQILRCAQDDKGTGGRDDKAERGQDDKAVGSRAVEVAFYRKYTEAMLRRYVKLSMEAGRVPSLLGREMFRGQVTHYRVHSFEDVVIFCHDVEKCVRVLTQREQDVLRRVAMQEYTQAEAAAVLGVSLRTVVVWYGRALDTLTKLFLEHRLLEPLKGCQ
jgi:predicted DNA-binding protein (UPF0251 family)